MGEKIPEGWKRGKLGEVVNIMTGKLNSNAEEINGKYPFFTCAPKPSRINKYDYDLDAILLAGNNANGIFHIHRYKGKFNAYQRTYIITKKDKENSLDYIFFSLKLLLNYMKEISFGSATRFLTMGILKNLEILLPPLPEQKAIASVLSSLDDKIDLLHRQNKTLEQMAETLFRKWFIEPCKNGLPENWEEIKLIEIVNIKYGKNLPTSKLQEKGYPVFGGNGQIGFYEKYLYKESHVLIACRGAASGKIIISDPYSFITNNSLILERTKKNWTTFEFLKYYALSTDFSSYVSGSAQPQITINDLSNATINIPKNKNIIHKFSNIIHPIEKKVLENKKQIRTLEKLRDTLLPKLMSGEIRVKE